MGGVGSWEGGWKFDVQNFIFFDDCIFHHWFLLGPTKTWPQIRPLPNVITVNTEIWWSAQGRLHLLCANPAFWDVVLLRQCIHMMHTMYLPPRCADPPQYWPKTGSQKSKVCMLSFWSGFLSHTYDRQKTMGRNWAYFQGHFWQVRRKDAIPRHLMKICPKYSEYPEDWAVLLSVFPIYNKWNPTKWSDFLLAGN